MKKRFLGFALAVCLILPCAFLMSACGDEITDCAYVQFVATGNQVVQYTSYMDESVSNAHIYLFENEAKRSAGWEDNYLLKISFKRNLGVDYEIDDKETLCVSIEGWSSMRITINEAYYSSAKNVYLNGTNITSKAIAAQSWIATSEQDGVYYFEDFGLVKGNTSNYINIIEYK